MAECNGCGRTIDDKYEYCPHCGTRRGDFLLMKYNSLSQNEDKRKKTVSAILAAGIVIVILAGLVLTVSSVSKKEYLKVGNIISPGREQYWYVISDSINISRI